jgi:hypothetical protein
MTEVAIMQSIFPPVTIRRNACGTVFIEQGATKVVIELEAVASVIQPLVFAMMKDNIGRRVFCGGAVGAGSEEPPRTAAPTVDATSPPTVPGFDA